MTDQPDDLWRCCHCGKHFPVQPMARSHETTCPSDPDPEPTPAGRVRLDERPTARKVTGL